MTRKRKRKVLTEDQRAGKIRKYNLNDTWDTYQPKLRELGFTEPMIDGIILRKYSALRKLSLGQVWQKLHLNLN